MNFTKFVTTKMRSIFSYTNCIVIVLLVFASNSFAQPNNDECSQAINICPNTTVSGTNIGATSENCGNCSDDFNFCFNPTGTVWYSFFTNTVGGNLTVNIDQLTIQNNPNAGDEIQACIVEAATNCDGTSYNLVSNCVDLATTDFTLDAIGLTANTQYFIVIGGNNVSSVLPAGATFDISITGPAIIAVQPTLTISTDSLIVCDQVTVNFQANTNCANSPTFSWFVDGQLTSVSSNPIFQTPDLLDGQTIQATVSCGDACPVSSQSNELTISIISVDVDAGPDFIITSDEVVDLEGVSSGDLVSWTPPNGLSNSTHFTPTAGPEETTTYTLTVSDGVCESSDDVTVTVIKDVSPFTIFTPNGDDANEYWEILGIERFPNCLVSVYDRWGQIVFESTGYSQNNRWQGTKKGKKLAAGVYFYVIELNDQQNNINKGAVTIIY